MKISEIHLFQKDLPVVDGPYTMSTMTLHSIDTTLIKMVTDTGLVGWGEVAPLGPVYQPQHALGARAAIAEIAPTLIGQDCLKPAVVRQGMDNRLTGHNYAKSGLEIALYDLVARHYGVRVCDLLGGAHQERVPAYYATGIGSPDEIARLVQDKIDFGYPGIQIKAGGRDVAIDIEVVHKVWEIVKGRSVILTVDPNRGMTTAQAKLLSLACRDIPFVLEQPCKTLEELVSVRSQIIHPIKVDENLECLNDVLRAISLGVCDKFCVKINRLGGFGIVAALREICAARSIPQTCEDSWGGDIIAAAALHMGSTIQPHLLDGVWTAGNYIEEHYDPRNGVTVDHGYFDVPKGVGLGINPDETRIGTLEASYA